MKKIILFSIVAATTAHAAQYSAEGTFGNQNAMYACGEAQEKALVQALTENSSMELKDLSFISSASYRRATRQDGSSYTATDCKTTLTLDGDLETFHPNRKTFRRTDDREVSLRGEEATVEKACAEAERQLVYWSRYAGGTDWEDDRAYASRLLGREYESRREWGSGRPVATCKVRREFSYVSVYRQDSAFAEVAGVSPSVACEQAVSQIRAKAEASCERHGLALRRFTQGGHSVVQGREGQATCSTTGSWSCFSE